MDRQDPTESTEQAEPTDPIDNTDPLEPIDNMDLSDQRLRKESVEPIDHLLLLLTCLKPTAGLQHAGYAPLNFGALQGNLAKPNVVQGFNALAPRIDLGPVDVPGSHIILEEQRQG